MEQIVVHVESRNAKHKEYLKSNSSGFTVGRAFTNDLIVSDQYIGPEQLAFYYDGEKWVMQRRDHTNPVLVNRKPMETDIATVKPGDKISIGRTHLRIYDLNQTFEAARPLPFQSFLNRDSIGFFIPALAVAISICISYGLDRTINPDNIVWSTELYSITSAIGVILVWAGIWALFGLRSRGSHFGQHVFCTAVFLILLEFGMYLLDYLDLALSSKKIAELGLLVLGSLLFAWLLKYNLFFATQLRSPALTAATFTMGLFFLSLAGWMLRSEQTQNQAYFSDTLGPSYWLPSSSSEADDHLAAIKELGEALDEEIE